MQYKSLLKRKNDSQEPTQDSSMRIITYIKANERRQCNIENFKCPICGNTDTHSIGILNGKQYCRRCISFHGEEVEHKPSYPKKAPIHLEYELSPEQKELSDKLVENYKKGIDSLVYAVCGSGKTEISLGVIKYVINCGGHVAFAVPRKDVVIELHNRLKNIFKFNTVVAVYGGHHQKIVGDIIVLTTHQLYRYKNYFSLIVLDEIDAFPFKDNEILRHMFFASLSGHYIMMSATPTKEALDLFKEKDKDILHLDIRFHRHPLPVPSFSIGKLFVRFILLIKHMSTLLKENKPIFIFCPTIEICENIFKFVSLFFKNGNYVHSKKIDRTEVIEDFRQGKYRYLVTTSVLERGVTLKNLQVIVFDADNSIYDHGTLIQISGRAGRKIDAPTGEVIFIAKTTSKEMEEAVIEIKKSNDVLQDMLQKDNEQFLSQYFV